MDDILKSAINRFKTKVGTQLDSTDNNYKIDNNFLVPIMQRQWDTHCKYPNVPVWTIFDVNGGCCQLVSNSEDQLMLNLALDQPMDYESLCKFKKFRFYNLFHGYKNIFELEFGGLTDAAIQITSELLTDVFGVSVNKEIKILEFGY